MKKSCPFDFTNIYYELVVDFNDFGTQIFFIFIFCNKFLSNIFQIWNKIKPIV